MGKDRIVNIRYQFNIIIIGGSLCLFYEYELPIKIFSKISFVDPREIRR